LNREEKQMVIEALAKKLQKSPAVFLADFKGLKVEELGGLRRKVREAGGEIQVVKNTLIRMAAEGTGTEVINDHLAGNNAVGTTTGDPAALAKALVEYAKTKDKLVLKGGALSGRLLSVDQVKAIADLPSRDVLLATLLGTMNAVPSGFVRVLAAVPQKLLYALTAIRDQKEAA
jgi:large subunit ribosomal protein L10